MDSNRCRFIFESDGGCMDNNINLRDLLYNTEKGKYPSGISIRIPNIQRDYAYGRTDSETEEKRQEFIDDISDFLKNGNGKYYFDYVFGSIVEDGRFILVDGQQRLTTLFLLYFYFSIFEVDIIGGKNHYHEFVEFMSRSTGGEKCSSRLLYETRESSRDFCNALVQKSNANSFEKIKLKTNQSLSDYLMDQKWFFYHWKNDSTVRGMLVFLDSIHSRFEGEDCHGYYAKLDSIVFEMVDLNKTTSNETEPYSVEKACELYIKMNSRGKRLTRFENLKNTLGDYYNKINSDIMVLLDINCTAALWDYYKKTRLENKGEKTIFVDNGLLAIINTIFINELSVICPENKKTEQYIKKWLGKTLIIPFTDYKEILKSDDGKNIADNLYACLKALFKKDSNGEYSVPNRMQGFIYYDETAVFDNVLGNSNKSAIHIDRLRFYAYCCFLRKYSDKMESDDFSSHLKDWMRLASNLLYNSRELINTWSAFITAIKSIDRICYYTLSDCYKKMTDSTGFKKTVFDHEKEKLKLINADRESKEQQGDGTGWEDAIKSGEETTFAYFSGQIRFSLNSCNNNVEVFKEYISIMSRLFIGENACLKDVETDGAFVRSLLSMGNANGEYYLELEKSNVYDLYGYKGGYDKDWSCYCRNAPLGNLEVFKSVIDYLRDKMKLDKDSSIKDLLERVVDDNTNNNGTEWKWKIINSPELFKEYCFDLNNTGGGCGFFEDKRRVLIKDFDALYSLGPDKKQQNAVHKEYYSYIEFCHLRDNRVPNVAYVVGTGDKACVEKDGKSYYGVKWEEDSSSNTKGYRKTNPNW